MLKTRRSRESYEGDPLIPILNLVCMLIPLLLMALGFKLYYITVMLMRARCEVLDRERRSGWVRELIGPGN